MSKIWSFFKRLFGFRKSKESRASEIPKSKKFALVIGVEKSAKFGSCPGAAYDSFRMSRLLRPIVGKIEVLKDVQATRKAVLTAMRNLIEQVPEDGLFILTYSGHGGSQAFSDTKDEEDGQDEYLCLYDTYLRDNDIWETVTKCKGRVFLIFDCCHSETMFRAPLIPPEDLMKDVDEIAGMGPRDATIPDSPVDMLVWSGCPDNTYSYGDSKGGLFTNALFSALAVKKRTYESAWAHIKADRYLSSYSQKPQRTILGNFDVNATLWN